MRIIHSFDKDWVDISGNKYIFESFLSLLERGQEHLWE